MDSPGHYSTARDLAVLTAYAMQNPIFAQTVSTKSVRVGERSLQNHNKLLWRVDGADGVKTGYTKAAGRILVSSAQRDGRRLICVTINDGNDWADHQLLLEDGFGRYENKTIVRAGDILGQRAVVSGDAQSVQLIAAEDFSFALTQQEQPKILLSGAEFDYAPVVQGENAGYAYILLDENVIGKIPVVYGQTVEQIKGTERKPFWRRLLGGAT